MSLSDFRIVMMICHRTLSKLIRGLKQSFSTVPISRNVTGTKTKADVLAQPDYFGVENLVTIEDLFNARVHYGHMEGCRNHSMVPYIFGCRNGVDIIDINSTHKHLMRALNFLSHVVYRGGLILFVMHSHMYGHQVEILAKQCGEYALTRKYRQEIFLEYDPKNAARLPDLCVFLSLLDNVSTQHSCIVDCAKVNIPTIGIADTNTDTSLITYPVPGNDDSLTSLDLYCRLFKNCVANAKQLRKEEIN